MTSQQFSRFMPALAKAEAVVWRLLLLAIPVAATPLLPLGSGTLERPLAILPAGVLLLLAAFRIVILRQKPKLGSEGFGLIAVFALYAAVSGIVIVSFEPPDVFKGQTPFGSLLRALITLGVGVMFYVLARLHIRSGADIRRAIRYLFIGMAASVALAAAQIVGLVAGGNLLRTVQAITNLFAVHYQNLASRAQGMAFESSWLATQIIVLLVPALIAGAISRQDSVDTPSGPTHKLRLACGFAVAIGGLLCSGSRFGLAAMIGMLLVGALVAARRGKVYAAIVLVLVLAAGGGGLYAMRSLGAGAGSAYVLGPVSYLTGTANLDTSNPDLAAGVTDTLALAGRVAALQSAANMWLDHPSFGVSLGNNFRYFGRYAPDWFFEAGVFTQGNREGAGWLDSNAPEKGNAKNMVLRLLSETGLVGLVLFGLFVFRQIFHGAARDPYHFYFRLSCALALGFAYLNVDTFTDPTLWMPLALCFALNHLPPGDNHPAI